jgi:hypothetical protein
MSSLPGYGRETCRSTVRFGHYPFVEGTGPDHLTFLEDRHGLAAGTPEFFQHKPSVESVYVMAHNIHIIFMILFNPHLLTILDS